MDTALRKGFLAVSIGWIGLGMMANATEAGTEPQFCAVVYNYVSVSAPVLENAEKAAHGIFERTGVETTWMNYVRTSSAGHLQLVGNAPCANAMPRILVNLIDHAQAGFPGEFLGVAPGSLRETGRYVAYVFNDMADKQALEESNLVAREDDASRSMILAHAMAHEIGHLLNLEHSPRGIMRAIWRENDYQAMAQGGLNFDPQQAARIRKEVILRTERLDASELAANAH